jgi:type II secretory pathway pseudopilin PulG
LKRVANSVLGVTLLEIMLVLAIAAMIIVMSIRYYQSATTSQQTNTVMEQLMSIVSAADNLAQSTGSYSASGVSNATLTPLLPGGTFTTPWGTPIEITATANTLTIPIGNVPTGVCPLLYSKLGTNNHYSSAIETPTPFTASSCTGVSTDSTIYYIVNP